VNIGEFIDYNGLVSPDGKPSGNGLLYSAYVLAKLNIDTQNDAFLVASLRTSMSKCQIKPGLFRRSPYNHDMNSFDDLIGVCAVDQMWAVDVFDYGESHRWCFNNVVPGVWNWKAWLGRNPAFVAHVMYCAGMTPHLFLTLAWCFSVATAGLLNKNNQDAWTLSAMMIVGNRKPNFLTRLAERIYKKRLKKHFLCLGNVFRDYFGHDHPIAELWDTFP
jgi:hypothetical protein